MLEHKKTDEQIIIEHLDKFFFSLWLLDECQKKGLLDYIPEELVEKLIVEKEHDAMRSLLYGLLMSYNRGELDC